MINPLDGRWYFTAVLLTAYTDITVTAF